MSDPRQLGEDCVTALHAGDVETLRPFLPEANLYAVEDGALKVVPRKFIDFLNVLKIDGNWRMAARIHHVAE
ncbi:MAG: hypothetical protein MI753_04255 [Hyphomicrobiales bacterium]|nr:hypothetical protein [Hyphomicrobiales bacterium]